MKKLYLTTTQIHQIIHLYRDKKLSANKIANDVHCSAATVIRVLKSNSIPIRNRSQCQQTRSLNDTTFENIDSHEKAYWLGILTGDGSVHDNHIALSMIDEEHIHKFRDFMGSSHTIRRVVGSYVKKNGENSISYAIDIWNEKLARDLGKYNLYKNKTQHMAFPININNEYINSYLLGLIDSDGWFHVNHKLRYSMIYIGFCGTYNMVNNVMRTLMKACDLNELKIQPTKSNLLFNFSYGGNLQGTRICELPTT